MSEEVEEIIIKVIRATDLKQFRHEDGSRIMLMPYFEKGEETWWWRVIDQNTDVEWLTQVIQQGRIYIFKQ